MDVQVENLTNSPELASANPLRAWMRNGQFHITGLTPGETLSIYSASGAIVYNSIAIGEEMHIPLRVQGVYIVKVGSNTVKTVYE